MTATTAAAAPPGPPWSGGVVPNVPDPERERATFTWDDAWARIDGLPDGAGVNIAHEAVDRHAAGPRRDHVAVRWVRRDGSTTEVTYGGLAARTSRFANVLRALDVRPGERVFTLLPRVPELVEVVMGTLKARSVLCPLFPAFGPEPVHQRMAIGEGAVLVTTRTLYDRKVAPVRDDLPALRHVLIVGDGAEPVGHDLGVLMAAASPTFAIEPTDPEETALLHFTSGTTGTPKGAVHVHAAVVAHHETGRSALDLHPDDVFWCTADPGWVTGTSYGVIAPLTHGVTSIVDEGDLDADRWYRLLQDQGVTVWYTAPTALRMLMRAGAEAAAPYDLGRLRLVTSVGEPLNPEVVTWGQEVLGLPVRDTWWQTETGGIMIATLPADPVRPGSMGRPLPGVEAGLLRRGADGRAAVAEDGSVEVLDAPDEVGELALRPGWPSIFRSYLHDPDRTRACFAGGWYLTGDLARRDAAGAYWFVGRADDVIKSAGHLIGPFEVESVLMEHPAVVEAGVIGVPDPVAGEVVKAFVTLGKGHEPSEDLRLALIGLARRRLGPAVAPRQLAFDQDLPHTRSGKVMRRLLKARELGLPEGDTSTLEASS